MEQDTVKVSFEVSNTGKYDGDEVAQVYVKYPETGTYMPLKQLHGFKRVHIKKGKTSKVTVGVPKKDCVIGMSRSASLSLLRENIPLWWELLPKISNSGKQ